LWAENDDTSRGGVAKKLGKSFLDDLAATPRGVAKSQLPLDPEEEPGVESVNPRTTGQKIDDISIFHLRQQTGKSGSGKIAERDDTRGLPLDDRELAGYLDGLRDRNQFTEKALPQIDTVPVYHIVMPGPKIDDAILVSERAKGIDKLLRVRGESEGENRFEEGDAIEPIRMGDHLLWLIDRTAER